jgi:hypothetical protein
MTPDPTLTAALMPLSALSDADALAAVNQPICNSPKDPNGKSLFPIFATYASIGEMKGTNQFGTNAGNVAGAMSTGLQAWAANPTDLSTLNPAFPNPGFLAILQKRMEGSTGLDFTSSDTPGMLQLFSVGVTQAGFAPILTSAQAAVLLAIGYKIPSYQLADVTAARAWMARQAALLPIVVALQQFQGTALNETLITASDPAQPLPAAASLASALAAALTARGVA